MGAWGEGAFENDSALDWLSESFKSKIESGIKSNEPEIVRAAAEIAFDNPDIYIEVDVIQALNNVLENDEWIESWNDIKAIKDEIRNDIKAWENLK